VVDWMAAAVEVLVVDRHIHSVVGLQIVHKKAAVVEVVHIHLQGALDMLVVELVGYMRREALVVADSRLQCIVAVLVEAGFGMIERVLAGLNQYHIWSLDNRLR